LLPFGDYGANNPFAAPDCPMFLQGAFLYLISLKKNVSPQQADRLQGTDCGC